jgi:two-component system NtrC family sensor kinase
VTSETESPTGEQDNKGTSKLEATWRLHFELASDPAQRFDVELGSEPAELGAKAGKEIGVDLGAFDARGHGVSRRHLKLWPTDTDLFAVDLDSTNGTILNGHRLEPNNPYTLVDGDVIKLGSLAFVVRFLKRPGRDSGVLRGRVELADALGGMAESITSQLTLDDVLTQALKMALALTSAGEATIWLVDEGTKELVLEAEVGIEDDSIRRLRLPVSDRLVSRVIESRKPLRANREPEGDPVKVKTGYIVEALLYMPLINGDEILGVMAVAHREPNRIFNARDERLLVGLANFAAIAIHNARLYEQLQAADRLKYEMIQNISHEFRTPLTYIVGYVGLLLEDREKLAPEHTKPLRIVQQQADKLTWLVKNFVTLRSPDEITRQRGVVDLRPLLDNVVQSHQIRADEKGITLSLAVEPDVKLVLANRMAIYQVVDNLLSNALKFTPPGGEVAVWAKLRGDGRKIRIAVTDTGVGIPAERLDDIFKSFYQVDGSTTRAIGGAGLGLAVVKSIVEAHGEAITVDSEQGVGSTFTFTLPVIATGDIPADSAVKKEGVDNVESSPDATSLDLPGSASGDRLTGEAGEGASASGGDDAPRQPATGPQTG